MAGERRIGGGTRLAGVIGWPVEHSRSPQMHNAAYAALGMDWAYVAMPVEPARLEQALRGAAALGLAGLNVTIPHKQATAAICDQLSPEARRADSANTPYNTRVRHGLPPTPICNPGLKSLEAAAHPANVNYLYYVAKPDGSHYFTDNYQDFLNHGG